ncbi:MAG: ribose-phosphate pyrophosphokinase, partial [Deltaproteobacteria bacterium RIFOXYA12_FULL_58_15]
MKRERVLLFSTRSYTYLRDAVAKAGDFRVGEIEVREFPDGERYQRIVTSVTGTDAVIIGGTISDPDTLELYDAACAIAKYGARSLTLVVPYFGYSTMERATRTGEVVTAKTRARLLSSIPPAAAGNRVVLVDVHTEGLAHYFEGDVQPFHLYATPVILEIVGRFGGDDFVMACTDAGRAKWVESLANKLGVSASFVFKRRLSGTHTEVTAVSAQVEGRNVVIYDDMIRTGGSLLQAAQAYRGAGAKRIVAVATHGLFPGDSVKRIIDSGLFEVVEVTDTHPRAVELGRTGVVGVTSIALLLARHL